MSASKEPNLRSGGLKLVVAIACLAAIWLVMLPLLAKQSHVAAHIQQQERLGIDPSAMFYSELEILPAIAHRVERLELLSLRRPDRPAYPADRKE